MVGSHGEFESPSPHLLVSANKNSLFQTSHHGRCHHGDFWTNKPTKHDDMGLASSYPLHNTGSPYRLVFNWNFLFSDMFLIYEV